MSGKNKHYVPALKFSWLTRFYDPVIALATREKVFRANLLEQAEIRSGDRVLDLGCGTATFVIMVKSRYPAARVTGLDGDPDILGLARTKTKAAAVDVALDEGMSNSMPYSADEFDTVFSSLFFHHLRPEEKLRTMKEVFRVLKPGGKFHVCDWGRPSNLYTKTMFLLVQLLDGFDVTRDNMEGRLPSYFESAGFEAFSALGHVDTNLGTLDFMSARKPVSCNG